MLTVNTFDLEGEYYLVKTDNFSKLDLGQDLKLIYWKKKFENFWSSRFGLLTLLLVACQPHLSNLSICNKTKDKLVPKLKKVNVNVHISMTRTHETDANLAPPEFGNFKEVIAATPHYLLRWRG
jgi:hypothetical protein